MIQYKPTRPQNPLPEYYEKIYYSIKLDFISYDSIHHCPARDFYPTFPCV